MADKLSYEELEQEVRMLRNTAREKSYMEDVYHSMKQAVIILDTEHTILSVNRTTETITGLSTEKLIGKKCCQIFHKASLPPPGCPVEKMLRTGILENVEMEVEALGKTFLISCSPVYDEQSNIKRIIHICTDMTELRQSENALFESEQNYKNLFDVYGDGILIADVASMQFIEANPAICKFLEYPREELLTKSVKDIHPPESVEAVIKDFLAQARGEKLIAHNIPCLTKAGKIVYADITTTKSKVNGRECNIGLFRDITEKLKIEHHLQQSQKMEAIGTLAGGIAHDFNNILAIIMGNISYAMTMFEGNPKLSTILLSAENGAKQAQNLIQQLLTFAKGGAPIKNIVDPNRLIVESAEFVLAGAASKCDYNFQDNLWPAKVDAGQINQAISNIIINANQAMPEGGIIYILSENKEVEPGNDLSLTPGPYIKIAIKDKGIGIPETHIANIFEPYFSTKEKGSGLGLAITYSIIKRHGGTISVESSPGRGTTFHIYLPASDKTPDTEGKKKIPAPKGNGRILIMDDQEAILEVASDIFNLMGYETMCARDGAQAIRMYRKALETDKPFNLVILDLTVPGGIGGLEAIKKLVDIDPDVVAVASSGYSNNPVMSNYEEYGFSGVVPKPYTVRELTQILNRLVDKS